jgi:hypothetical protein
MNITRFLSNIRTLARPNLFRVSVALPPKVRTFIEEYIALQGPRFPAGIFSQVERQLFEGILCSTTHLPGKVLETRTTQEQTTGPDYKLPYNVQYGDIPMTFMLVGPSAAHVRALVTVFSQWQNYIHNGEDHYESENEATLDQWGFGYLEDYWTNLWIDLLDPTHMLPKAFTSQMPLMGAVAQSSTRTGSEASLLPVGSVSQSSNLNGDEMKLPPIGSVSQTKHFGLIAGQPTQVPIGTDSPQYQALSAKGPTLHPGPTPDQQWSNLPQTSNPAATRQLAAKDALIVAGQVGDVKFKSLVSYQVERAWPVSVGEVQLDWQAENQLAYLPITFTYYRWIHRQQNVNKP